MADRPIVLASGSPRRRDFLRLYVSNLVQMAPNVEEVVEGDPTPQEMVEALALIKAKDVAKRVQDKNSVLIACDTIVCLGSRVLGKPKDEKEASEMLHSLSGSEHSVISGVCLYDCTVESYRLFSVETKVWMRSLDPDEISDYISTGEPFDKAGGYGIQGLAGIFVERIEGSYTNVVGLPLCELHEVLISF